MKRAAVFARIGLAFGSAAGCGGLIDPLEPVDASPDTPPSPYAAECADAAVPPSTIECTGLYTDVVAKTTAAGVRSYAPAIPLWADGAEKQRWILLPHATVIDATDPNEWTFPVGTKVWKEFQKDGRRVETRLFEKVKSNYWVRATYAWNADASHAVQSFGGDIPFADGGTYHIPTPDECDQCHRGRTDRILGFEQVDLGLSGASGLTLADLSSEGLLAPAPARVSLTIGDDGTGEAASALAWLHINCGTTCHSANSNAMGYGSGLRLRLDPTQLDGRSSSAFDSIVTTVGAPATSPSFSGELRIAPGQPSQSLLYRLMSNREADGKDQMPPIATRVADAVDDAQIDSWIAKMSPIVTLDGGGPVLDAQADTAVVDSGRPGDDAGQDATIDALGDGPVEVSFVDASLDGPVDAGLTDGP